MKWIAALWAWAAFAAGPEAINHHPFPFAQPVGDWMVAVPANGRAPAVDVKTLPEQLVVAPAGGGLRVRFAGSDLGVLTWAFLARPASKEVDHAAEFEPLALSFKRDGAGWQARSQRAGFNVTVRVRPYRNGFLDTEFAATNASATQAYGMYAAAVVRWQYPSGAVRSMRYDNRDAGFDAAGRSRFSAGEGRHWFLQHGIDWLAMRFAHASAVVLSAYSHSPTALDDTPNVKNKSPRFTGLNVPQFKNEARATADATYMITELVRGNRAYRDRFVENRLPEHGQTLTTRHRIVFSESPVTDEQADQAFAGYNTYRTEKNGLIEIGVPHVTFGTSYFPYSTLGENFGKLKLPGQETDAFWPLSADTVTEWRKFAGDIRRDLRILKAMGFSVVRLHYVDVIAKLPENVQFEYLDFLFGEIRHLGLRAMFSTAFPYWSPDEIAARVARYKDAIDRVELENEILIWGIPLDRPQYWARVYDAVKRVAPSVQVHLTSHLNTGIFDRLEAMRVRSDVVSAHSYIDALDAIPSGRGFAFAVGSYARDVGKPAIYTEWNWRGLTRMTPEARAAVYPPIIENLLATRSISEFYQFQFQQTMCVNPRTRKGIRQYEPLWLSRRPKPEALELMKLIDKYSSPAAPNRQIGVDRVVFEGSGEGVFEIENRTPAPMRLKISVEAPEGVAMTAPESVSLRPGERSRLPVGVRVAADAKPGFYHAFLRLEAGGGVVRYAWAEIRKAGQPEGATLDLNRPMNVVYRKGAPVIDVETAYMLHQTIESASGRPAGLYSEEDLPAGATNVLRVGTGEVKDFEAAVDFVLKYWKHAKDSAAAKVGLVEKQVLTGADVANLP